MPRFVPIFSAAALTLLGLLATGCERGPLTSAVSSAQTEDSVEVADATSPQEAATVAHVEEFEAPTYLPALGDEDPGKGQRSHRRTPPPPVPTPEEIAAIAKHVTKQPVGVGVPASDRTVWGELAAQPQARDLIREAGQALDEPIAPLTAELWQRYEKTGDRTAYQDASTARYNRLRALALGEALEYEGRFIPAIEETLTAIFEQGAWSVPAHGKGMDVFEGERIVVDLAASQLSWTLATVDYWLAAKLPAEVRARLKTEVERRVLHPYLEAIRTGHAFWWMDGTNNWSAVCCGSITGAALSLEPDVNVRAEFIADAEVILGRYIDSFSDEGISEEGIGYWSYGFSHFLYASEAIRRSTGGAIDLLDDEKVFRVSQSPLSLEIADNVYGAFGDQSVNGKPDKQLYTFAARRYGLRWAEDVRFDQISKGVSHPLGPHLYSLIIRTFGQDAAPVEGFDIESGQADDRALRSWFPQGELYICRPGDTDQDAMSVAIRISNNGESHNHNDVGSYVVVYKGVPVLADPGMERYTAKSFGPHRYESGLNNSFGHPVPLVANRMQKAGEEAFGEILSATPGEQTDTLVIDLTEAYRSPGLEQLIRTLRYERPGKDGPGAIVLTDCVRNSQPEDFSMALITRGTFTILSPTTVKITDRGVSLYARVDAQGRPFAFVESPITGFTNPDKAKAHRLGIYLLNPVEEACLTVTVTPTPPDDTPSK